MSLNDFLTNKPVIGQIGSEGGLDQLFPKARTSLQQPHKSITPSHDGEDKDVFLYQKDRFVFKPSNDLNKQFGNFPIGPHVQPSFGNHPTETFLRAKNLPLTAKQKKLRNFIKEPGLFELIPGDLPDPKPKEFISIDTLTQRIIKDQVYSDGVPRSGMAMDFATEKSRNDSFNNELKSMGDSIRALPGLLAALAAAPPGPAPGPPPPAPASVRFPPAPASGPASARSGPPTGASIFAASVAAAAAAGKPVPTAPPFVPSASAFAAAAGSLKKTPTKSPPPPGPPPFISALPPALTTPPAAAPPTAPPGGLGASMTPRVLFPTTPGAPISAPSYLDEKEVEDVFTRIGAISTTTSTSEMDEIIDKAFDILSPKDITLTKAMIKYLLENDSESVIGMINLYRDPAEVAGVPKPVSPPSPRSPTFTDAALDKLIENVMAGDGAKSATQIAKALGKDKKHVTDTLADGEPGKEALARELQDMKSSTIKTTSSLQKLMDFYKDPVFPASGAPIKIADKKDYENAFEKIKPTITDPEWLNSLTDVEAKEALNTLSARFEKASTLKTTVSKQLEASRLFLEKRLLGDKISDSYVEVLMKANAKTLQQTGAKIGERAAKKTLRLSPESKAKVTAKISLPDV